MPDTRVWFVYIIECRDKKLYTGITLDLDRRIAEHNRGVGCKFTKYRWPVELVFKEHHSSKSSAQKREIEIKKLSRAEKFKLIRSFALTASRASGSKITS